MKTLSILVPIYNEKETLLEILAKIREVKIPLERKIIMVDDGSTDGTRDILQQLKDDPKNTDLHIVFHEQNQGKGAALQTAIQHMDGDIALIQDADLEYDPRDYMGLLSPILEGKADVVYGSRFLGGPHRVLFFWHYLANRFLTFLSNALNNINLTDMETCYKVFRGDILKNIRLQANRFGIEPEITAKIARRKYRIYEVPISYYGRNYAEGKKITWKDGFAALYYIFRFGIMD